MIRFQPDTLRDALWRPITMAMPDAGIYMEGRAPDLRFGALLLLSLVLLASLFRGRRPSRTVVPLVLFTWLAFAGWVATSGNGRYLMPVLLLVGPVCIVVIHQLPSTRGFRLFLAGLLVVLQIGVLVGNDPRRQWSLVAWGQPYFSIDLSPRERSTPAAYVLATPLSYSLIAPQFDPRSRWLGIAYLTGDPNASVDDRRAQAFLAQATRQGLPLRVVMPSYPGNTHFDDIRRKLEAQRLAMGPLESCEFHYSATLASLVPPDAARSADRAGFQICPLQYPVDAPRQPSQVVPADVDRAFRWIEAACPRLFPRGLERTVHSGDTYYRYYHGHELQVFVREDGEMFFKYWRALQPNHVGRLEQVLASGATFDCHRVNGRSGLPWERSL